MVTGKGRASSPRDDDCYYHKNFVWVLVGLFTKVIYQTMKEVGSCYGCASEYYCSWSFIVYVQWFSMGICLRVLRSALYNSVGVL